MAAVATSKPISNIAIAFAGNKTSSYNVAKPRDASAGKPNAGARLPGPSVVDQLLTPPNSISPTLPPHKVRSDLAADVHADSDIDLQDAVEHAAAQDHPTALSTAALSGLEAVGAITPSMLAKHHLPDILLANGPMAIRHVLSYLAQSVPGFSRIPPAKARRLVVSALESRGGGGLKGEVEFEKVGWGRWDARVRGQAQKERRSTAGGMPMLASSSLSGARLSPPASLAESYTMSSVGGLQIPRAKYDRRGDVYSGSWASNSMLSRTNEERSEDLDMAEHEADKMSLDGSEGSHSQSDDEIPALEEDLDDATDEEDWAAIGAAALRRGGSIPKHKQSYPHNNGFSRSSTVRRKSSGGLAKSVSHHTPYRTHLPHSFSHMSQPGARRTISAATALSPIKPISTGFPTSSLRASSGVSQDTTTSMGMELDGQDSQERAAIEALLQMGSM